MSSDTHTHTQSLSLSHLLIQYDVWVYKDSVIQTDRFTHIHTLMYTHVHTHTHTNTHTRTNMKSGNS